MVDSADLVIVGAGTLGGWASVFAARADARVIVVERDLAGAGASSRAAGVVRAQGGTPETVAIGRWSIDFYNRQAEEFGTDSGFRELGYLILARTAKDERAGRGRVEMQRDTGLDVRWVSAEEACELNPTLTREGHRGGSYFAEDGCVDPPRNVRAYSLAMQRAGVELHERTEFLGVEESGGRVVAVRTSAGDIATERVLLTGGPTVRAVGRLVGARIFAGGARHQVAVTEPHAEFDVGQQPMVFDIGSGLYWRLEEGGLLFGMSNPKEVPGPSRELDQPYLRRMQRRLNRWVPATVGLGLRKAWAATIEYTPDHFPIVGSLLRTDGSVLEGASVAVAAGHGMMWGPAVARIAADLALDGKTDVTDVSDFGMDRFDEHGHSKFYDPIALPFPVSADDE